MKFLRLEKAVSIGGLPHKYVGPFNTAEQAEQWVKDNASLLDKDGANNVVLDVMAPPA